MLLQQLSVGSEEAFRTLFKAYRDKLYTYILKLSGSVETAEDIVHDVFLKLWVRRERLTEIENLNNYLYRMAHNQALTVFRRMAKETLILAEIQKGQGLETGFEGEDQITHREVLAFIRQAVDQLTPQQKQVFLMSREQGLKLGEIARRLDISERTVKNHISKALRFLREEIGGSFGANAIILYVIFNLSGI
jgi:RNA polymerase sigma-70 factor (ECF subfamily)